MYSCLLLDVFVDQSCVPSERNHNMYHEESVAAVCTNKTQEYCEAGSEWHLHLQSAVSTSTYKYQTSRIRHKTETETYNWQKQTHYDASSINSHQLWPGIHSR